jgi:class 3 adenylate cyclase
MKVSSEIRVACHSDICALWTAMTDTERMNRAVGMAKIALTPLENGSAARYLASTKLGGFNVEYEERPYEWQYLKYFRVLRKMRNGPARSLLVEFLFDARGEQRTDVAVRLTIEPRVALLAPIVKLSSGGSLRRFAREIRRLDEELRTSKTVVVDATAHRTSAAPAALDRAARALEEKAKSAPELTKAIERVVQHVREGSDFDLSRIRPYPLADAWGLPRRDVLVACLEAVGAGLLEMRWDLVCPSCRTAAASLPSLGALKDHGHCQLCDVQFGLDFDEAVEATFSPTTAVRRVDAGPYCVGGPARTPHVLTQAVLPSGQSAELLAPDEPGAYRVFVRGGRSLRLEVGEGGPARTELCTDAAAEWPARSAIAPRGVVALSRAEEGDVHVKLERFDWVRDGATARDVTALPVFRRSFSSDLLRDDVALQVSRVALLFSDLTDSTRLYAKAGDAAAFRLVQDHFTVLLQKLEAHNGVLVKTIGDAVMAAFADDLDAVRAGLAIVDVFAGFRESGELNRQTDIKLGAFAGPCYAVTANGTLDYFGQTVNIAARLQGLAKSGELVIDAGLAKEARAAGILQGRDTHQSESVTLKGVGGHVEVVRLGRI